MKLLYFSIGLILGNFIIQYFGKKNYNDALYLSAIMIVTLGFYESVDIIIKIAIHH